MSFLPSDQPDLPDIVHLGPLGDGLTPAMHLPLGTRQRPFHDPGVRNSGDLSHRPAPDDLDNLTSVTDQLVRR
jgi:hypothetical protein